MSTPGPRQMKSHKDVQNYWLEGRRINTEIEKRNQKLATWYRENRPSEILDQIYKMARLARAIDSVEELDALLAVGPQGRATNEEGMPLTWKHFIVLMAVKSKAKRLQLAKETSRESLSLKEMRARAGSQKRKSGRKPTPPKSPKGVLETVSYHLGVELLRIEPITDKKQKNYFGKCSNSSSACRRT